MNQKIEKVYLNNHSHTDLGFTDHQDVVMRQHVEFIDKAIELCEYTEGNDDDSKYRWTCEVTGITERWFQQASDKQIEKFLKFNHNGQIDVAGMQWNFTPMLGPEQMVRSLYPVKTLREQYGVKIQSAMQSDSNGISWMFADLLPEVGIDFLTMAVNPLRGGVPKPCPQAFWWEGPSGNKTLAWNGFHYLFGRSNARLGDWEYVDRFFPKFISMLENDERYPWNFLYCQSTHPIRVDNGPPDIRMIDFVKEWNSQGREPKLVFSTPTLFREKILSQHEAELPTLSGDWLDWWCDGVASSAYETGLNRTNHVIMNAAEILGTWGDKTKPAVHDEERLSRVYEYMSLYDEHTWGAFASVTQPDSLWTKSQWNYKASFAYRASGETHDMLARAARNFADEIADRGAEGRFNLGDLTPEEAFPTPESNDLLILNPLPWERTVIVTEPEIRAGGAPVGMLETFVPRGIPWGGEKPTVQDRRIRAKIPAFGFAFLDMDAPIDEGGLKANGTTIENEFYKLEIDSNTGAIKSLFDKELNKDFAGRYNNWDIGQLIYQQVDPSSPGYDANSQNPGRAVINALWDFSQVPSFGAWNTEVNFAREIPSNVKVHPAVIDKGRAAVSIECKIKGVKRATCIFWLDAGLKEVGIDWEIDKEHVREAEELLVAFPFDLGKPQFRGDINGVPFTPDEDQLPGTVRDWFPVRNWIDISDDDYGVTLVPIDAPLMQLGGITTAKGWEKLDPEGPNMMSWALNNHWIVNFKASQGGLIPLRYRLTTHKGKVDDAGADRWATEVMHPPIVMRDYIRRINETSGSFMTLKSGAGANIFAKRAEDGSGIIMRIHNAKREDQTVELDVKNLGYKSAEKVSPTEIPLGESKIDLSSGVLSVELKPAEYLSLKLS